MHALVNVEGINIFELSARLHVDFSALENMLPI